jgi:hypothetical protein
MNEWYMAAMRDGLVARDRWTDWAMHARKTVRNVRVSQHLWCELLLARWAMYEQAGIKVDWRYDKCDYLLIEDICVRPRRLIKATR